MGLPRLDNPPNPWDSTMVEYFGQPPEVRLEVFEDSSRSILSRNDSPDLGFRWSLNPYRGCFHGCSYCYARPTHEYLGFGAGTDFERRIVVKPKAPALLRRAFARPSWRGELVLLSGNTDCYQPLEARYELTRACLEVCLEHRQPVHIITKSPLIERDIPLLVELHRSAHVGITLSIPFADAEQARAIEPYVAAPKRRFETIRRLSEAGLSVGVNVAPILPGLNDGSIPEVLAEARRAGAQTAGYILLRLPGSVATVFEQRLREALPLRAERILARTREVRAGRKNDPRFGMRMHGEGNYAASIERLFHITASRLGFTSHCPASPSPASSSPASPSPASPSTGPTPRGSSSTGRSTRRSRQLSLF